MYCSKSLLTNCKSCTDKLALTTFKGIRSIIGPHFGHPFFGKTNCYIKSRIITYTNNQCPSWNALNILSKDYVHKKLVPAIK